MLERRGEPFPPEATLARQSPSLPIEFFVDLILGVADSADARLPLKLQEMDSDKAIGAFVQPPQRTIPRYWSRI